MIKIKYLISIALFLIPVAVVPTVAAKTQWSDNSITLVSGEDYELTPDGEGESTIVTLEHVSGHSWGDLFFFVDYQRFENDQKANYWELTPRFSLGKLTKKDFSFGIVKDVLLDTTVEVNTGPV
ncbi:MAG: outer membrane protein OmpK [Cellvibrionaceae bacterium]